MASKISTLMNKANSHLEKMTAFTNNVAKQLSDHLGEEVGVCYQYGDGWVVVHGDGHNSKLSFEEMESLLKMSPDEGISKLMDTTL